MAEKASLADRRANALQGEMEEARALLDSAERGKRQTESELAEARGAVNEMNTINSKAGNEKRRLEGIVHTMHAEIDDMLQQAKYSEEKAKKAMVDAACGSKGRLGRLWRWAWNLRAMPITMVHDAAGAEDLASNPSAAVDEGGVDMEPDGELVGSDGAGDDVQAEEG